MQKKLGLKGKPRYKGYFNTQASFFDKEIMNYRELPFKGYMTNGGVERDEPELWIRDVFSSTSNGVGTRSPSNVHMFGALEMVYKKKLELKRSVSDVSTKFFEALGVKDFGKLGESSKNMISRVMVN